LPAVQTVARRGATLCSMHADTRCLIVDDNRSFLAAGSMLLERQGLDVVGVASTGSEAVRKAEALRPDVVLVDISLGEESGLDVACSIVSALREAATVILISTRAEEDVTDLIADCPAAGFIPKSDLSASAILRIAGGG
jgi:DNA-binding NarL/FixJ family response regulator